MTPQQTHNAILNILKNKELISASALRNSKQPLDFSSIVKNIAEQFDQVSPTTLTSAIAEVANLEPLVIDAQNITYQDKDSLVAADILFLTNPFDNNNSQQKLQLKQQGKIKFSRISVADYNSQHLQPKQKVQQQSITENEIIAFWQAILKAVKKQKPSDVHFTPEGSTLRIEFRIQANLKIFKDIDSLLYKRLLNYLLSSAGLNNAAFTQPQKGKIIEEGLEFRLQTLPTNHYFEDGNNIPKLTLRAHHRSLSMLRFDQINLPKAQKQILESLITFINQGAIIIAGPTGAGKTTLLYALLVKMKELRADLVINTLEDPPEVNISRITQSPINKEANLDYGDMQPPLLRSDIDVALISEIRDTETAQKSLYIPLSGHIAFATIHATDAISIIARLEASFGIKRDIMQNTLNTLIGQRIVKKVCPKCSVIKPFIDHHHPTISDKSYLDKYLEYGLSDAHVRHFNPQGCQHCEGGYEGLLPILEIFELDTTAKRFIAVGESITTIQDYLVSKGDEDKWLNKTMLQSGVMLMLEGQTTIDELLKLPFSEFSVPEYLESGLSHDNLAKIAKT